MTPEGGGQLFRGVEGAQDSPAQPRPPNHPHVSFCIHLLHPAQRLCGGQEREDGDEDVGREGEAPRRARATAGARGAWSQTMQWIPREGVPPLSRRSLCPVRHCHCKKCLGLVVWGVGGKFSRVPIRAKFSPLEIVTGSVSDRTMHRANEACAASPGKFSPPNLPSHAIEMKR